MRQKEEKHVRQLDFASTCFHSKTNIGAFVPYRNIDFGVLAVFVLKLLHPLLLPLPLLLVQAFQVLASLVLLQHLVAFKLLVTFSVIVLQVLGCLENSQKKAINFKFFSFRSWVTYNTKQRFMVSRTFTNRLFWPVILAPISLLSVIMILLECDGIYHFPTKNLNRLATEQLEFFSFSAHSKTAAFHLVLYDLTVEMSSSRSLASKVFWLWGSRCSNCFSREAWSICRASGHIHKLLNTCRASDTRDFHYVLYILNTSLPLLWLHSFLNAFLTNLHPCVYLGYVVMAVAK